MQCWAQRKGIVTAEEIDLVRYLRIVIDLIPEIEIDSREQFVSCHMLARAIKPLFPHLRVADGYYYQSYEHSWLVTQKGNIIDVYPVAGASGPILIAGDDLSPSFYLYKEKRLGCKFFAKPWFRKGVRDVRAAMVETMRQYPLPANLAAVD